MLHSKTMVLNREKRPPRGASLNFQGGAQALTRPTRWKVCSLNLQINTFGFTVYLE